MATTDFVASRGEIARKLRDAAHMRFYARYAMPASVRSDFKYLAKGDVLLARSIRSLIWRPLP